MVVFVSEFLVALVRAMKTCGIVVAGRRGFVVGEDCFVFLDILSCSVVV